MSDHLLRTDKKIMEIYDKYVDMVYKVCFMFLKNIQDTEDAVQTIFIKLMQSESIWKDDDHLKAWLIVTAQNHCKNLLRFWWRKKRVDIESIPEQSTTISDQHDTILEQVLSLPPKYKTILYLYYYEGYSSVEISKILKRKESTVRSQLHTGRKLLKISVGGSDI